MAFDTQSALGYNAKHAPKEFFCPASQLIVEPATQAGLEYVLAFQEAMDSRQQRFGVDGKFGPASQRLWQQIYGKFGEAVALMHPMPWYHRRWGYMHGYPYPLEKWPSKDEQFRILTEKKPCEIGAWLATMLRFVSGYKPSSETFSRGLDSTISLDTLSLWVVHYWAGTMPKLFVKIVEKLPVVASLAWPAELIETMRSEKTLSRFLGKTRGKTPHDARLNDFVAGWFAIARLPEVIEIFLEEWSMGYPVRAIGLARQEKWDVDEMEDGGKVTALIARVINSRGVGGARSQINRAQARLSTRDPMKIMHEVYHADDLYDRPDRWKKVTSWKGFEGKMPALDKPGILQQHINALNWDDAPVVRADGKAPPLAHRIQTS